MISLSPGRLRTMLNAANAFTCGAGCHDANKQFVCDVQGYMKCVWSLLWLNVAKDPFSTHYVYGIKQTPVRGPQVN